MDRLGRGATALVLAGAVLLVGLAMWRWATTQADTPEERSRAAARAVAGVRVATTVGATSQAATEAVADFGIEEGVRMVRVRFLGELELALRIETAEPLTLAGPPRVCLVGPYSAPDDAGLTDRCWGEPDLGELVAAQLALDADGHPILSPDHPVDVAATLGRGDERCDYPPGTWQLEVSVEPLVDGSSVGPIDLAPVVVPVPPATAAPLPLQLLGTRYCGLANAVYREQGEPAVLSP